jgi:hypothetical protein
MRPHPRTLQPTMGFTLGEWAVVMVGLHHARPVPDQTETGPARRVHGHHGVHQNAVGIAGLNRSQAAPALRMGGKFHFGGILNGQHMPSRDRWAGPLTPASHDFRRRHLRVGKEPPDPQLTSPLLAEPTQADRLARHHLFEDRRPPCRGAHPRMSQETSPSRQLLRCRPVPNRIGSASDKRKLRFHCAIDITCAYALAFATKEG